MFNSKSCSFFVRNYGFCQFNGHLLVRSFPPYCTKNFNQRVLLFLWNFLSFPILLKFALDLYWDKSKYQISKTISLLPNFVHLWEKVNIFKNFAFWAMIRAHRIVHRRHPTPEQCMLTIIILLGNSPSEFQSCEKKRRKKDDKLML